jgi:phosphate acetyltransferase
MSGFLAVLRERAAAADRRLVFPEATEDRTLDAIATIVRERLARPVLLGEPEQLEPALATRGIDRDAITILDPAGDERRDAFAAQLARLRAERNMTRDAAHVLVADPLFFAALLVRAGEADGCVAGAVRTTADVLRAAIWCVGPAPHIATVSSAFYMLVPAFRSGDEPEVLTFTDAGVVPTPSPAQLADIAEAAVIARRRVVGDEPRVAFLSFSTKGSASGPEVLRVRQGFDLFRVRMPDVIADGELQADAALISTIAARKAPLSPVAGNANILVFPGLDAGNIAYKLVERIAAGIAVGPILQGLARPCNDLSRGAAPADIVNVACITALLA